MSEEIEIRRLPKKTIYIIVIMVLISAVIFLSLKFLKEEKMTEIVSTLGYKNIKQMQVINKLSVEDKKTKYKSTVYKIRFFDMDTQKTCIGFVHLGRDHNYTKDFDCK